jgi:photosystem II stability/assembly factor-like uncharacterized protein
MSTHDLIHGGESMKNIFIFLLFIFTCTGISIAQWVPAYGAGNGDPTCVLINDDNLFAVTEYNSIIHSVNKGKTWSKLNTYPEELPVFTISNNKENIYVGTFNGVMYSLNNGINWIEIKEGLPKSAIIKIGFLNNYIFASTADSGVFRTSLESQRWIEVGPDGDGAYFNMLGVAEPYVFAYNNVSLFRSSDAGENWTFVKELNTNFIASNSKYLFADDHGQLYRSVDLGMNWENINRSLPEIGVTAISANDSILVAGTYGRGLYISKDNGNTWNKFSIEPNDTTVKITSVAVNDSSILVGTDLGVYYSSDNGVTWGNGNANLGHRWAWSFVSIGSNLFIGANGGVFRSSDNGENWTCVLRSGEKYIGDRFSIFGVKVSELYAVNNDGEIFRSYDLGSNWEKLQSLSKFTRFLVCNENVFAYDHFSSTFDLLTGDSVWLPVNNGMTNIRITDLVASDSNLFAIIGTDPFESIDNGINWFPLTLFGKMSISTFIASGLNIFVGNSKDSLFLSNDAGKNWISITSDLPNLRLQSTFSYGKNIFVSVYYQGVYLSTDCGLSWTPVNQGLKSSDIGNLIVHQNQLFAIVAGKGVWKRPLSDMITLVNKSTESIPSENKLFQNYPNPFNPTTIIRYQLTRNSLVTLKVYDIMGREVIILLKEQENAGAHFVTFNASNLSSGVYFYRLETDSYSEIKKFVLLK